MKVYLAARFSRLPELLVCAAELEAIGITVTSRWIRGGHEWVGTDDDVIPVDDLARFAREDLEDIEAADLIVCFTEAPRSGPARGGRHVEMGYALARGIPILTVGYRENVFYCLPEISFVLDWNDAVAFVRGVTDGLESTVTSGTATLRTVGR